MLQQLQSRLQYWLWQSHPAPRSSALWGGGAVYSWVLTGGLPELYQILCTYGLGPVKQKYLKCKVLKCFMVCPPSPNLQL